MNFRLISTALATTALIAAGGIVLAQDLAHDKSGENMAADAPNEAGVVADLATAQTVYHWGVEHDSAVAVAAAARIAISVDATDVEREHEQAAIEGAETGGDDGASGDPADAEAMLAKAVELAGDDQAMLALIEDIRAEAARGRIGGASRTLARLPAGYYDSYRIPYYGGRLAELSILGDGDADLDLLVTDENGNTICYDTSYSDQIYCRWMPRWDGYFYVVVKNMGRLRNSYFIVTN